jgi:hypothetical protein
MLRVAGRGSGLEPFNLEKIFRPLAVAGSPVRLPP